MKDEKEKAVEKRKEIIFKSKYFLRCLDGGDWWFTGNHVIIDDHFIEYRKRNWYFISVDSRQFHWQYIQSIDVDKHLFGATVRMKMADRSVFVIRGMGKKTANQIRSYARDFVSKNSQRGTISALAGAIASAGSVQPVRASSNADELMKYKQMYDQGIISEAEFQQVKKRLL